MIDRMGALLVGAIVATVLWGVTTSQVWSYFSMYLSVDPLRLKVMVSVVYGLDTSHQVMVAHLIYTYLVTDF
ncbi:hypothetical protein MPER_09183, partial [Moniliophthora perniciosa FA553]